MVEFYNLNGPTSLIKNITCYKNPDKPTRIDLVLTNQSNCFQRSNGSEIGLLTFTC